MSIFSLYGHSVASMWETSSPLLLPPRALGRLKRLPHPSPPQSFGQVWNEGCRSLLTPPFFFSLFHFLQGFAFLRCLREIKKGVLASLVPFLVTKSPFISRRMRR